MNFYGFFITLAIEKMIKNQVSTAAPLWKEARRGSFQRRDDTWILIDSIQGNKKSRDMNVPLKMKWEPKDSL